KLRVGSVKSNIGHLESASGVAGVIKTVLAMKNHELPPTLHFQTPNPAIDFETLRMRVVCQREPWLTHEGAPRIAGVNSFGFGGTNAHVVLAESPRDLLNGKADHNGSSIVTLRSTAFESIRHDAPRIPEADYRLLPLSSKTESGLRELVSSWKDWLVE